MRLYASIILLVALSLALAASARAQISLNNMPSWTGNSRFYNDVIAEVKHPSLTLNGFDSSTSNHGHGLRQVLEQAYEGNSGGPVVEVYDRIQDLAADNNKFHPTPSKRIHIIENTQRIQAQSFMALATYVMARNGEAHELESLPDNIETPDKAAGRLRSALLNTDSWRIVKSWKKDGVKWTGVLENMARTIDLYLALENAYQHYGHPDYANTSTTNLLGTTDKELVLENYARETDDLGRAVKVR